jgi:hypothetical protein
MLRRRPVALAIAGLIAFDLVYWLPILIDPWGRVAGGDGDPLLVAYLVTWVAEHLGTAQLWHPPFFHPASNVLAYSEHFLGFGMLSWPAVTGGISPVVLVNGLSWLAFLLTSLAVFWWLSRIRGDVLPSAVAAIAMTYGAWRTQQSAHPQLLFLPFLPLAILWFTRGMTGGSTRLLWLGAAALLVQSLCTPSLTVFTMPMVAIWMLTTLVVVRQRNPAIWLTCVGALALVVIANLPIAAHYWQHDASFERDVVEMRRFSVRWENLLAVPGRHWLYGNALADHPSERELFPGFAFACVLLVGLVARPAWSRAGRAIMWPLMVTVVLALWASNGPSNAGEITLTHLPYDLLLLMPGGRHVRVPARFFLVVAIFLAPVVATGWQRVFEWIAQRCRPAIASAASAVLVIVAVAEALPSLAFHEPAPNLEAPALGTDLVSGGVLFLPLSTPHQELRRMWRGRDTGVPVVNGYSGHSSALWNGLHTLQSAAPDLMTRQALYNFLLQSDVDTIVLDEPVEWVIGDTRLKKVGDNVFRIPSDVSLPTTRNILLGLQIGLLVPDRGWSNPEQDKTDSWVWAIDDQPTILVPMDGSPLTEISLRVRSLSSDDTPTIELHWNGRSLGTRPLEETPRIVSFPIPAAAAREGWTRFQLVGPPRRPVADGRDPRRLSFALFEIVLR